MSSNIYERIHSDAAKFFATVLKHFKEAMSSRSKLHHGPPARDGDGPIRNKLAADYDCWPLWMIDTRFEPGNIDLAALPLSSETVDALNRWAEQFTSGLDRDNPAESRWSREEALAFYEDGRRLWRRLRKELGNRYEVFYSDLTGLRSPAADQSFDA